MTHSIKTITFKMLRLLPVIGLVGTLLMLVATGAQAQREVSDYNYQYEQYIKLYPDFETKRNEFLKYQTLTSQQEAVAKTEQILVQRAQVLRTYFYALRFKVNSNDGIVIEEKARLSAALDQEIGWLQNHMDTFKTITNPSLSQLFEVSDRLELKQDDYAALGYEALAHILIGKVRSLHTRLVANNQILETYVAQVNDAAYLLNWIDEAQSNAFKASQAITRAESLVKELRDRGQEQESIKLFASVQAELGTAQQNLKKGVSFQKEIIRDLNRNLPDQPGTPVQPEGSDSTESATVTNKDATSSGGFNSQ